MPELPEVETVVRGLRDALVGQTITDIWYNWERTISQPSPSEFAARIQGQRIERVWRRAKYIVCDLQHDVFMVHLKMTGRLYLAPPDVHNEADLWVHFKLLLEGGEELRFSDLRKFGKVYLAESVEDVTGNLGPEPLDDEFTPTLFKERLRGRSKVIKSLLMDQTFIAGVGNIYADEALFRAGIHPQRRSDQLSEKDIITLHGTVRQVLQAGIDHEGASINWYRKADGTKGNSQEHFNVYGRTGKSCRTCGQPIEKIRVGQRGTHYCSVCQPIERGDEHGK